jgi:hypothetical protein
MHSPKPVFEIRPAKADSDQMLVERVQRGDKAAFDALVRKYQYKIIKLLHLAVSYRYQYSQEFSGSREPSTYGSQREPAGSRPA